MNWYGKRYYSYGAFLKNKFGSKVGKISVDGGFTCPNRDGTISKNGCIFCSPRGSGDFCYDNNLSVTKQIENAIKNHFSKWKDKKIVIYFQAYTNTYASIDLLKKKYEEALSFPNVVGLSIATRPDCINNDTVELLKDYSKDYLIFVELGLQSIHKKTALYINRGYDLSAFNKAIKVLDDANLNTVVHLIFGLPNETQGEMIESIKYIAKLPINGVKMQLLYILKDTPLEKIYKETKIDIMTQEEYVMLICNALSYLPENFIIHRLTGDAPKEQLLAPTWSKNKRLILNDIDKYLLLNNLKQGIRNSL